MLRQRVRQLWDDNSVVRAHDKQRGGPQTLGERERGIRDDERREANEELPVM